MRGKIGSASALISAVVDERTWNVANIAAAAGSISQPYIYDYTAGVGYDEIDLPVSISLGHQVDGNALFKNDMDVDQIFSLMLEFIDPDGVSRGQISYPSHLLHAYAGLGLTTDKVILDIAGMWKLHALMEA